MASGSPRGIIPPPAGVEANFVNPEYRSGGIVPITAVFVTLSTVFLALRIYTKARIIKVYGLEDITISLAWLCTIGASVICLEQQKYGNGIHMWNITVPKFLVYQRWAAASVIIACPAVALPKVAILVFYLRVNPTQPFRYSVFAVLFITIGYMIALCLALFFQCQPIAKSWNPLLKGQCLNQEDLFLWNSILNVFADFLVLILPIPMLRKLQVGMRQKWIIALLFGVGSLTCIVSIVRTYYVSLLFGTTDTSWKLPTPTSLVVVETNLSVICGCIMVLRPFVRRHLPFLLGSQTKRYRAAAGAAIYDGYNHSETKTKVSSGNHQKHSTSVSFGAKIKSWVGNGGGAGTRATDDTDSTFVGDGRDVELGKVGWPLESGREKREVKSESEENIIERPRPTQRGIVKTVDVDVRRG